MTENFQIIGTAGPVKNDRWTFTADRPLTVGANAHCRLHQPEAELGKAHFMLAVVDGKPVISALAGETLLNGKTVTHSRLKNGDEITAGRCRFQFLSGAKGDSARSKKDSKRHSARRSHTPRRLPVFDPARDEQESTKRQTSPSSSIRLLPLRKDRDAPQVGDDSFQLLYQSMREMSMANTESELLKTALGCLFKALKFRNGAILLKDPDSQEMTSRISWTESTGPCAFSGAVTPSRRLWESAAKNMAPSTASGLSEDGSTPCTLLCVPILHSGEALGVIYLELNRTADTPRIAAAFCQLLTEDLAAILDTWSLESKKRKEASVRRKLARHLPAHLASDIAGKRKILPSYEKREISVLCCELKGASAAIERLEPSQAVSMINAHLSILSDIVFRNGGMLDKLMGGGLLAIFGAREPGEQHALAAVHCAIQMQQDLPIAMMERTRQQNWPTLQPAIAITTGKAVLGEVGAPGRTDYTALGGSVELAATMLKLTQGGQILLTETTFTEVKQQVDCEIWGSTAVTGKAEPEKLYSVTTDQDIVKKE